MKVIWGVIVFLFCFVNLLIIGISELSQTFVLHKLFICLALWLIPLVSFILCLIGLIPYLKHAKTLKKGETLKIEGEVIGFRRKGVSDVNQLNDLPVVKNLADGKIIDFKVNSFLEREQKYCFEYLEHTKVSVVIDECSKIGVSSTSNSDEPKT